MCSRPNFSDKWLHHSRLNAGSCTLSCTHLWIHICLVTHKLATETSTSHVYLPYSAPCALTNTLVNSEGPGDFRGFSANFVPILSGIFHYKVLGARLFKQALLAFGLWHYMVCILSCMLLYMPVLTISATTDFHMPPGAIRVTSTYVCQSIYQYCTMHPPNHWQWCLAVTSVNHARDAGFFSRLHISQTLLA